MIRTYSELITFKTFEDRFNYLKLSSSVGEDTFGFYRYLNQKFYHSTEWKTLKRKLILRDNGCDLGVEGYELHGKIYIHHLNPISVDDVIKYTDYLTNPEFLICTSFDTHQAIHYGNLDALAKSPSIRVPNDTCPWKL